MTSAGAHHRWNDPDYSGERPAHVIEDYLHDLLGVGPDNPLYAALIYSLDGGARLRPRLCFAVGACLAMPEAALYRVAAAVEMLHGFSLIQDDLPCMDNDGQRRGKPATHRKFGEYQALLAANALFARAFQILSEETTNKNALVPARLVAVLAQAAGGNGICLGQWMDLAGTAGVDDLLHMFRLKSGALFGASLEMPAILAGRSGREQIALRHLGESLGIIYQIHDDILDCRSHDPSPRGQGVNIVAMLGREAANLELVRLTKSLNDQLDELEGLGIGLRHYDPVNAWPGQSAGGPAAFARGS